MPRSATQPSRIPIVDYSTLSLLDKGIFDRWQLENPDGQQEEMENPDPQASPINCGTKM